MVDKQLKIAALVLYAIGVLQGFFIGWGFRMNWDQWAERAADWIARKLGVKH